MSKYPQNSAESDEDMEDIPSQFDSTPTHPQPPQPPRNQPSHQDKQLLHQALWLPSKHSQNTHQDTFLDKTQRYMASRLKKINDIKDEHESRIMANCTFKPQINKSASKSPRNIKQFLESQQNHLQKISQKKQWIKQQLEDNNKKNMTFSPKINRKKNSSNKENVHSRLYKLKDKPKLDNQSLLSQTYSHIPKITKKGENIVRKLPVNQLLYLDAQRRAEREYDFVETDYNKSQKNFLQEKYVAQKFLKDFTNVLNANNLIGKTIFDEEQLGLILRELGYVRYSSIEQNSLAQQEKRLLRDCFQYLQQCGVTQINVYVFLLALGGIYNVDLNNSQIESALVVDDCQGKKLHSYFDLLYRNRLFSDGLKRSKTPDIEPSYRHQLTTESQQMASRYRGKMIDRTNTIFSENNIDIQLPQSGLSHQDLLAIYNLSKNLEKEKLRQAKNGQKDPQCTFQPNADKYPQRSIDRQRGEDKCKELYQAAKMKQNQSRLPTFRSCTNNEEKFFKTQDKSPIRPENTTPSKSSNVKSYLQIKDVDKTLSRMVMGRKQRSQRLELEQRGQLTSHKPIDKKMHARQPAAETFKNELLLDADILVNNEKKKIYIYKEDENRISEVVDQFAHECELDSCSRDMLYERLIDAVQALKRERFAY